MRKYFKLLLILISPLLFAAPIQQQHTSLLAMYNSSSQGGSPSNIDFYAESNQDTSNILHQNDLNGLGQSITGDGTSLTDAQWYLSKTGSPTGNATIALFAVTGTHGTDATPTGAALATTTLDVSTLTGSLALTNVSFGSPYTTGNGTHYVLTIVYNDAGSDADNYIEAGSDGSTPSHDGNMCYSTDGSSWTDYADEDMVFYAIHTP
jgi:hypothetical protein